MYEPYLMWRTIFTHNCQSQLLWHSAIKTVLNLFQWVKFFRNELMRKILNTKSGRHSEKGVSRAGFGRRWRTCELYHLRSDISGHVGLEDWKGVLCKETSVFNCVWHVMLDFVGTTFKYAHLDIVEKVLTGHCGWHSVCQGVNVFR